MDLVDGDCTLLPKSSQISAGLKSNTSRVNVAVVKSKKKVPREAGKAPSLEMFKARLNEALSDLT